MASIGKRILSAFVEMQDEDKPPAEKPEPTQHVNNASPPQYTVNTAPAQNNAGRSEKFAQYFDKLFRDANLPGPDYFEFSKMIEAMISIPDERSRYSAAYAGLSVQGLEKDKLVSTATEYLRILEKDAANFDSTVDAALHEKVHAKQKEIEERNARIQQLTKEISDHQQQIAVLNNEIKENVEKIENNSGGYKAESERMKQRISLDIEKIKQFI